MHRVQDQPAEQSVVEQHVAVLLVLSGIRLSECGSEAIDDVPAPCAYSLMERERQRRCTQCQLSYLFPVYHLLGVAIRSGV